MLSPLSINHKRLSLLLVSLLITTTPILASSVFFTGQYNGFSIHSPLVPLSEIHHGGPARDGIPSINQPKFIPAKQVNYLDDNDRVLGIQVGQQIKAYPIRILNWHEIVNDGDILISYCPLCGTGMAFKAKNSNFGVSGLLYNSDMLLYDRETESLWSQILSRAISGKRKGEFLQMLPIEHTSWFLWQNKHPDTLVLSRQTGFSRSYSRTPYGNYEYSKSLYFPVVKRDLRYHPKEKVIGLQVGEQFKAYPFTELDKTGKTNIQDTFNGKQIQIEFNPQHRSGIIKLSTGETIPTVTSYWFAWYAFHPDTAVYQFIDK